MLTPFPADLGDSLIATDEIETIGELVKQIQLCSQMQFTGRLDLTIKRRPACEWSLFFQLGYLTWATSETHSLRRWCRQLSQHCPQVMVNPQLNQGESAQYLDYEALIKLVKWGKVSQQQLTAVVTGILAEILFDIVQVIQLEKEQHYRAAIHLAYRRIPNPLQELLKSSTVLIAAPPVWQQAEEMWNHWRRADLVAWSPNLAPVVWDAVGLKLQTPSLIYNNLVSLANGERTIRDLALLLKQRPLEVLLSIKDYIAQDLIRLIEVGDLHCSVKLVTAENRPSSPIAPADSARSPVVGPAIAYIEDSQFDTLTMRDILTQIGYRFINIQDPVQALPLLLELKPSLIFLDLIMPNTNGYEVCTQIRRTSVFKTTPVIIITSSDGIIDRVRAKLVRASGFLAKPITPEKVQSTLKKYLMGSPHQSA